jgi:acyl-coenzyme A synthetase/AMP-(fatty) acid ligase
MAWTELARLLACDRTDTVYACAPMLRHDDFTQQALAVAGGLRARQVHRVGLWFDDAAQLAVALFGCWRAGAVAVLASDARAPSCAAIDGQVDLWLTDHPALPVPATRRAALTSLSALTSLTSLTDGAAALPTAILDLEDAGVVLCTSGSSGVPKQIFKHWRQLAAEIEALERQWHWSDTPACVLGSVSAQHMYGLPFRVLWPLAAGRSIDRRQLPFPEALEQASLAHPSFTWIASPALLKRLGDRLGWDALRPGIRQIFSAGGPLPEGVSDLLHAQLGCRPTEIYGSSETGAVAWRQGAAAWQPLPGVQVDIDADALCVRSPWLAEAGGLRTADAAAADGAGGFHLRGRLDRIVKIEEKRIALPGLEQKLAEHPYVREARLDVADAPRLTALVALAPCGIHALRNQGRKTVIEALRAHMTAAVEPLGVPRHWRMMRELPWNAQGKLPRDVFLSAAQRPRWPHVRLHGAVAPVPSHGTQDSLDRGMAGIGPRDAAHVHGNADAPGAGPADIRTDTVAADMPRELTLHLEVPLDLVQFSGHFPGTPVVPGVVQIEWAMGLARRHLWPSLGFHGMEALKFQQLLRPGDAVALSLSWHPARGKLYFEYRLAGQPCSSGRILARSPDAPPPRQDAAPAPPASLFAAS